MIRIDSKLDALSFLYNFEMYAERESDGSYLFMFPVEFAEDDIDVFHIYKQNERWAVIGDEIAPGHFQVRDLQMRDLVDYVFEMRHAINDGIEECV